MARMIALDDGLQGAVAATPKPVATVAPAAVAPKPVVAPAAQGVAQAIPKAVMPTAAAQAYPVQTAVPQAATAQPSMPAPTQVQGQSPLIPGQSNGTVAPAPGVPNFTLPALDGSNYVAGTGGAQQPQTNPVDLVNSQLQQLLEGNYAQNARLRGAEVAGSRGLRNSSIAAGASERAAMEAVQPLLSEAQNLTRQRENLSFQGQQNQLDRIQGVNDALLSSEIATRQALQDFKFKQTLQGDAAAQEDWLNNNQYLREFNATLSTLPIKTVTDMMQMVTQYALENPEIYPPNTISGLQNFLSGSVIATLQQYFPNLYKGA